MESQSSTAISLSIDEMVCSLRTRLDRYCSLYKSHICSGNLPLIHRVKKQIRDVDPAAYEPIFVSIGPYHHSAPNVLSMEREKWKCLKFILNLNGQKDLQDYLLAITRVEEQVRICYQDINIDCNTLIQMLLLDACFLLHSLYATNEIVEPPLDFQRERDSSNGLGFHERVCVLEIETMESAKLDHQSEQDEAHTGQCHRSASTDARQDQVHDEPEDSPDETGMWYTRCVTRDMLLLENQIPFFVLKIVYEIIAYKKAINTPLIETLAKYIEGAVKSYPLAVKESDRPKEFIHLLHLCHFYFRPSQIATQHHEYKIKLNYFRRKIGRYFKLHNQCEDVITLPKCHHNYPNDKYIRRWRRAVQYHEAGVQFKKREHSEQNPHSLLDIAFHGSVLEIPRLIVDDETCTFFRNFIAFEQSCPQFGNDLTAYVAFVSKLISTADDVTLLARRGIVVHHMRSDAEVSNIFCKLGRNVEFDLNGSSYLKHLCQQLEDHYQNRINRWLAWLWQNHFSNPWLSLAVVAATVVLICTILQTLLSFLTYWYPEK